MPSKAEKALQANMTVTTRPICFVSVRTLAVQKAGESTATYSVACAAAVMTEMPLGWSTERASQAVQAKSQGRAGKGRPAGSSLPQMAMMIQKTRPTP